MSQGDYFLVSGGAGGIGSAVCVELAARGLRPVIGYCRSNYGAKCLAKQTGGVALSLDLTSLDSINTAAMFLATLEAPLAGVVLAGSPPPALAPFGKIIADDMLTQWHVNVLGPQQLLAELVRQCFRKQKRGAVVGVLTKAMGAGIGSASSGMGAYVMAKYGMLGVLSVLAADYPWLHVRTVSPGYTDTQMLGAFDERFLEMQRDQHAFSTPQEIARMIIEEVLGDE